MPDAKEPPISASVITHPRPLSRLAYPLEGYGGLFPDSGYEIRDHLQLHYPNFIEGEDMNEIVHEVKRPPTVLIQSQIKKVSPPRAPQRATPISHPRCSRARLQPSTTPTDLDFLRRASPQGNNRDPEEDSYRPRLDRTLKHLETLDQLEEVEPAESSLRLIKQSETRPPFPVAFDWFGGERMVIENNYFRGLWCGHHTARNRTPTNHIDDDRLPTSFSKDLNTASNNYWPFYFESHGRVSKSIARAYRRGWPSLKHTVLCVFLWLGGAAGVAITTNSASYMFEPSVPPAPIRQHDSDNWAWLLWPAIVIGILFWELATVRILGQPLLFHGVSMGIFGVGYLLMVFSSEIPFYIQFSTWLGCAAFTAKWIRCDIQDMSTEPNRITALALVVLSLLLDLGIISTFKSGDDLAMDNSQSKPFLFVAFLLPCVSLSAFVCSCFRSLYNQTIQRNGRVPEQQEIV